MMYAITLDERRAIGCFRDADEFTAWRFGEQGGVECQVFETIERMVDVQADIAQAQLRALAALARQEVDWLLIDAERQIRQLREHLDLQSFLKGLKNAHPSRR